MSAVAKNVNNEIGSFRYIMRSLHCLTAVFVYCLAENYVLPAEAFSLSWEYIESFDFRAGKNARPFWRDRFKQDKQLPGRSFWAGEITIDVLKAVAPHMGLNEAAFACMQV
jgi:hypothetical protein